MFYSKTTNGFYDQEINGDDMPADVVSVTEDKYNAIQAAISAGGTLYGDDKGYPQVEPLASPTEQQLIEASNAKNRSYLAETDWYVARFVETGVPIPEEIKQLREEARKAVQ
jgi:hypothetical protein